MRFISVLLVLSNRINLLFLFRQVGTPADRKIHQLELQQYSGLFIKPKDVVKKFTGCVVYSISDLYQLQGSSHKTIIYCSPIVNWLTEYRVFVCNGQIIAIKHYHGDATIELNMQEVHNTINCLENSEEGTAGYGIDFGVLANGETALIEWNDGFGLGSYGLDKELYTNLIIARWEELTKNR
jgi:ATP-grasp domain, R2K clade family 2